MATENPVPDTERYLPTSDYEEMVNVAVRLGKGNIQMTTMFLTAMQYQLDINNLQYPPLGCFSQIHKTS